MHSNLPGASPLASHATLANWAKCGCASIWIWTQLHAPLASDPALVHQLYLCQRGFPHYPLRVPRTTLPRPPLLPPPPPLPPLEHLLHLPLMRHAWKSGLWQQCLRSWWLFSACLLKIFVTFTIFFLVFQIRIAFFWCWTDWWPYLTTNIASTQCYSINFFFLFLQFNLSHFLSF